MVSLHQPVAECVHVNQLLLPLTLADLLRHSDRITGVQTELTKKDQEQL